MAVSRWAVRVRGKSAMSARPDTSSPTMPGMPERNALAVAFAPHQAYGHHPDDFNVAVSIYLGVSACLPDHPWLGVKVPPESLKVA